MRFMSLELRSYFKFPHCVLPSPVEDASTHNDLVGGSHQIVECSNENVIVPQNSEPEVSQPSGVDTVVDQVANIESEALQLPKVTDYSVNSDLITSPNGSTVVFSEIDRMLESPNYVTLYPEISMEANAEVITPFRKVLYNFFFIISYVYKRMRLSPL